MSKQMNEQSASAPTLNKLRSRGRGKQKSENQEVLEDVCDRSGLRASSDAANDAIYFSLSINISPSIQLNHWTGLKMQRKIHAIPVNDIAKALSWATTDEM